MPGVALIAKVTDSQGAITTSATVTVQVLGAPSISLSTLSNYTLAGSSIDLNATATPAGTATITKVEFFANNGTTNQLIGTVTTAPYNFRWTNVVAGSYSFTAKVTDSQTLTTTSAAVSVTVATSVTIQLNAALNGSTVNDDAITVSGTVGAPPNSAVNVNGQFATVTSSGQFFLNDLNLQPGANTVTATVTAPDGQTANQTITITRSAAAPTFTVAVTPAGGIATATSPLVASITVANPGNTAFATITVVCSDPGPGLDFTAVGTYTCSYNAAGVYGVRVTMKDNLGGVIYSVVKTVKIDAIGDRERLLRSVYSSMLERLKAGNIAGALNTLTSSIYDRYQTLFTAQGAGLSALVDSLGTIQQVRVSGDLGEFLIVRNTANGPVGFMVYFIRAEDGIWRIDSM